jgi:tetratricopeptide (TPR) repeat protein
VFLLLTIIFSGKFYCHVADYHSYKQKFSAAMDYSWTVISLATAAGNTKRHAHGLCQLAWIECTLGDSTTAQVHAQEAWMLAKMSGDLWREAWTLYIEATCWSTLGNYKQSILLDNQARDLISLCGMTGGDLDHTIMNSQAGIHFEKSEYLEAHNIHTRVLQEASVDHNPYNYGRALLNVTGANLFMGAPKENVLQNLDTARKIFKNLGRVHEQMACDMLLASVYLEEQNFLAASTTFQKCIESSGEQNIEITSYCLEKLADLSQWDISRRGSLWPTLFLVHSLKIKERLGIHKGLQFFGDFFLAQDDEATAVILFTVALEGFTQMDVHRSRAECMLRIGDISQGHNEMLKAVELWEAARALLERSSQAKQIKLADQRLSSVSKEIVQ